MASSGNDIHIKGGVLVSSSDLKLADIFVKNGRIESVESPGSELTAKRTIDATGKFVLPGIF
jgi:dihydroorotase-like cyclic amidohydrolase